METPLEYCRRTDERLLQKNGTVSIVYRRRLRPQFALLNQVVNARQYHHRKVSWQNGNCFSERVTCFFGLLGKQGYQSVILVHSSRLLTESMLKGFGMNCAEFAYTIGLAVRLDFNSHDRFETSL